MTRNWVFRFIFLSFLILIIPLSASLFWFFAGVFTPWLDKTAISSLKRGIGEIDCVEIKEANRLGKQEEDPDQITAGEPLFTVWFERKHLNSDCHPKQTVNGLEIDLNS